jgi:hypothetical protein
MRTYALLAIAIITGTSVALAQKIALVVGNNSYQYASQLNSPIADAVDVSRILDSGGFKTLRLTDANQSEMSNGINTLGIASRSADICLFYFSGHGIEVNGANYLVPIDGRLRDQSDLETQMIPLNSLLNDLRQTGARRKIIILDCCRSDPFNSVTGGLAAVPDSQFPLGTLIVYAGAPGRPVPDGTGRNSPFTEELIRQLQPGRDVLSLFASVAAARFRTQDPWIKFDGSGESFADLRTYDLLSGAPSRPAPPDEPTVPESRIASYWNHNGSTMGLLVNGNQRILIYIRVRKGLEGLVEPGTVLFAGESESRRYQGKARRFSRGLPPIEYDVDGPILDGGDKVVLSGRAPIRNPDGSIKNVIEDRLEFSYLKLSD